MGSGLRITIRRDEPYSAPEPWKHKYGGLPTFTKDLPECKACRRPLLLLFQFDVADPQLEFLRLPKTGCLPVLSCLDCDLATAGHLYYKVEGSRITVLRSDATESFEHWEHACPERNVSIGPIPRDQLPSQYDSMGDWWEHMIDLDSPKHQLGGTPCWVQGEHGCDCPECKRPMRFIGQVDSETWPVPGQDRKLQGHMFGDMGILYVFHCDGCRVIATGGDCF